MSEHFNKKASNDEIKTRFDNDVACFSNLDTGQLTTIDASHIMELCTDAKAVTPSAKKLIGHQLRNR
ncbi:hypothetical protein [Pedobacter sp. JCM 36344]|uniref:hypothetical protein n=1 Tax=Pedobacter sp. JCM 36344 TaxID=3374280 RepID=UPI00397E4D2B